MSSLLPKRFLGRLLYHAGNRFPVLRSRLAPWGLRTRADWFPGKTPEVRSQRSDAHLKLASFSENYLSFELFWKGMDYYEPVSTTLAQMLTERPGGLFVDAGANIGFYSLMLASMRPDLDIVAFEPHPHLHKLLQENVRANRCRRVKVEGMAVSESEGVMPFYLNRSHMSASLERNFDTNHTGVVNVGTVDLDGYLRRHGPVPSRFTLKLDIEGHEAAFFRGAKETLKLYHPDIIAEVAVPYTDETVALLRQCGYQFRQMTHEGLKPCVTPKAAVEGSYVFLNCLLSTRSDEELDALSDELTERCRSIDLAKTSKLADKRVLARFRTRVRSAAGQRATPLPGVTFERPAR